VIQVFVKVIQKFRKVEKAADKAQFRNFFHAAARIRKDAAASIERAEGPSLPGQPPHTHRRVFLRRAWRFAADKEGAVIGPRASIVGQAGAIHEFGGTFRGQEFPARPTALPALERNVNRFATDGEGTIGE
jgi:hypothetical protein